MNTYIIRNYTLIKDFPIIEQFFETDNDNLAEAVFEVPLTRQLYANDVLRKVEVLNPDKHCIFYESFMTIDE